MNFLATRFAQGQGARFPGVRTSPPTGAVAATAKHLAAYGAVQAGREYAPVDMSERQLHEVYLPPFKAAVQAGVAAIMPAFTDFNGTPMTANAAVLRDIVRRQWGLLGRDDQRLQRDRRARRRTESHATRRKLRRWR